MSRNAFSEALGTLASRMPRVVREHEILRISASVLGDDTAKSAKGARDEVLRWAQRRSGGRLPEDAWAYRDFEYLSGGRNSVGLRIEKHAADVWAVRADDPDKAVAGRVWTTEVVVGVMADQLPRFSARLLVSTHEDSLNIEPHTPGFVRQVAENCGLTDGLRALTPEPWVVQSEEAADQLVSILLDPSRKLPVFILTVPEGADDPYRPLLDGATLAQATLGIAHVVVLPASLTWVLTEQFGKQRSVFGGAVRAYLAGFSEDANPYAHRLTLGDHLTTEDGVAQCMRWMRSLAAEESIRRAALGRDVLAFATIRNANLQLKQQQLADEGANEGEQLATANARIKALEKQTEEDATTLDYYDSEHKKAEERAEAAEEQARASAFRIQQLLEQIRRSGSDIDADIELPKSWDGFVDWCDTNLAGRVTLSPRARRELRSPEFEDVQLAARCLLWLANDCRNRRINGGDGTLGDEPVEDGVRNSHCGGDQFDLDWQGRRHTADWHIKNGGNTRDPKRCLRIYYFWDPQTQQIVVAEMPGHRRTAIS